MERNKKMSVKTNRKGREISIYLLQRFIQHLHTKNILRDLETLPEFINGWRYLSHIRYTDYTELTVDSERTLENIIDRVM